MINEIRIDSVKIEKKKNYKKLLILKQTNNWTNFQKFIIIKFKQLFYWWKINLS